MSLVVSLDEHLLNYMKISMISIVSIDFYAFRSSLQSLSLSSVKKLSL